MNPERPNLPTPPHIKALIQGLLTAASRYEYRFKALKNSSELKAVLSAPPEDQVTVIAVLLTHFNVEWKEHFAQVNLDRAPGYTLKPILSELLRRDLPLDSEILSLLLRCIRLLHSAYANQYFPVQAVLRSTARYVQRHGLNSELRDALEDLRKTFEKGHYVPNLGANPIYAPNAGEKQNLESLVKILSGNDQLSTPEPKTLDTGEPWVASLQAEIANLSPSQNQSWKTLLHHLQQTKGAKPTAKWLKHASTLMDGFGKRAAHDLFAKALSLAANPRSDLPVPGRVQIEEFAYTPTNPNLLLTAISESTLKGMAWASSLAPHQALIHALGDLGESCWKKIPGYGPRSQLVGNAILWSLSTIGTNDAVAQLTRINSKLKHASARKLAHKALNRVVENTGQSREDLEEIAVPTFGLNAHGSVLHKIDEFTCSLFLTPAFTADIAITDRDGKPRKSIPQALKVHPEFSALKKTHKQLTALLPSQRLRLESLLRLPNHSWSFENWRDRYLCHPLLRHLGSRLIWQFTNPDAKTSAMLVDDTLTLSNDQPLPAQAKGTRVQLWHPCTQSSDSVRAWRDFLDRHQITQPFKQAHREVYLLTDAERRTNTYSNRFAAHIIRQHQFNALCAARGWQYKLQGGWDSGNPTPTLDLPNLNYMVEFWVEPVGLDNTDGESLSGSGVALHLSTDQVRFYSREPYEQVFLHTVPPQLFSEILRDVDLFVGVASVGNDPTWQDGGPQGRFQTYWQSYSFGDLNESAKTRKAVLENLIPRLKIAKQCSLSAKFLRVQGTLRAYKIHLGSGNILMEPNDQYLCIVPTQSGRSPNDLFLPFEGDTTLSVIISKAFLLAADEKITDPTITRQIKS